MKEKARITKYGIVKVDVSSNSVEISNFSFVGCSTMLDGAILAMQSAQDVLRREIIRERKSLRR